MNPFRSFELIVDGAAATATVARGWLDLDIADAANDAVADLIAAAREHAQGLEGILVRTSDDLRIAQLRRQGFRPSGVIPNRPPGAAETTLVLRLASAKDTDDGGVHAPKRETFNPIAMTNVDPKGVVRPVEEFRIETYGLYLYRHADHPRFHAVESWLLPDLDLRANIFHFRAGFERDQRTYLDIAKVWRGGTDDEIWYTEDWYLDIVERPGRPAQLIDIDELFAAVAANLLPASAAERAIRVAVRTVAGITRHDHSVDAWLASEGIPVSWRPSQ